jgi:shikimate dehydrogenase
MNFLSTITGCFAQPAAENRTVAMIEAAYQAAGVDARIDLEVASLRPEMIVADVIPNPTAR